LSKYRAFLAALQPRTLLIEEAAETLEGKVIGGLFESLQQLILVGDQCQLQAACNVQSLKHAPYHMNVSMFERLILNNSPYTILNTQRRMVPNIRQLLTIPANSFYENLLDHALVLDRKQSRPPVLGMGNQDCLFFHHNWPEARNADFSRYNQYEASFIARFFEYLTQNGTDPSKITVLTVRFLHLKYVQQLTPRVLQRPTSGDCESAAKSRGSQRSSVF
jgi:helicase required for RNAi-mediated heterochromatin assembly 1